MQEKYPWELLGTDTLMQQVDILTYHLYKKEYYEKNNCQKEAKKELQIIKSYMYQRKEEKQVCLKK